MIRYGKSFYGRTGKRAECGNATIYVLVVVALFAALTIVLSRQSDNGEQGSLSYEKTEVYSNQIIQVSNQVKQGIDQMIYSGSDIADLIFTRPSQAGFNTAPTIHKIFHADGGGIVLPRIPAEAVHEVNTNPAPGFYIGRFNNVEWTPTTETDVILLAHQISEGLCAHINEILTGSATIPALSEDINKVLIDAADHTNGPNVDLDTTSCPGCEGKAALCVVNDAGTIWSYYNVIEQR